jgi:4-diphosphocytidyl-2-C-methyl-D-erythritol kinase
VNIRAHAKINLSLAVCGVRADGYHELSTVFQSLALHDTLRFDRADEGLAIACAVPAVPRDERNLVWKAARLVWDAAGRAGEPVGRVHITKRIPVQGGLGGGSADGAAALVGWDALWETRLPDGCLRELAVRLGADVPFFLCAGTALGRNRGDELHPLDDGPARWVVLVFPPFGVSTAEAFRWWDEDHPARALARDGAGSLVDVTGGARLPACGNDLEPPVTRRHPVLLEIRQELERAGAEAAAMTGSGSTIFGLFASKASATAAWDLLGRGGRRAVVTRTATRRQARLDPGVRRAVGSAPPRTRLP